MNHIKNGITLTLVMLIFFVVFTGCEVNSGNTNLVDFTPVDIEPAKEVAEVKKWNKEIGENITLLESRIEVRDGFIAKKFDIEVKKDGKYYLSSLAGGVVGDTYTVVIDNGAPNGKSGGGDVSVKLNKGGWSSASLLNAGDGSTAPVFLKKGIHTISFEGENIPNIVELKAGTSLSKSMFELEAYYAKIEAIKAQPTPQDYASKAEAPNNPEISRKDDPLYAYNKYYVGFSTSSYTFRRSIYLTSGTTCTFETKQPSGAAAIDTVMYLYQYNASGYPGFSYVDDDGGTGTYSKITAQILVTGTYYVVVRSYGGTSTTGVADIYKDGSLWQGNIDVGGYKIYINNTAGDYRNYFTAHKSTNIYSNDSYAWVTTGSTTGNASISKFNDDCIDEEDYDWGYMSRIRTGYAVRDFFISKFSIDTSAEWRVYTEAWDKVSGEMDHLTGFENLKAIDRIRSGAQTNNYNCISWSGGITSSWVWPLNSGSPWYSSNALTAFDNFYGNTPSRYSGAPTYTRTGATSSNSKVDLWYRSTGDDPGYTHGSVHRIDVDGNYHGYDWESKTGGWARIFHPRHALSGSSYGYVNKYYIRASKKDNDIETQQESIDKGLTVIQKVALTKSENDKLTALIARISANAQQTFNKKYEAWKQTWEENMHMSDPRAYARNKEYKELLGTLKAAGKASWAFAISKHQEDGILVISLIEDLMLPGNEVLMTNVRAANWAKAQANKAAYEVPTLDSNWTTFEKEILNNQL